jgi:hypothetical protein
MQLGAKTAKAARVMGNPAPARTCMIRRHDLGKEPGNGHFEQTVSNLRKMLRGHLDGYALLAHSQS